MADELLKLKPDLRQVDKMIARINAKTHKHKLLTAEKKTIVWSFLKRNDLAKHINHLTGEPEKLRSEKARLLARFDYTEDSCMKQEKSHVKLNEKAMDNVKAKENRCEQELAAVLAEFQTFSHKAKTTMSIPSGLDV